MRHLTSTRAPSSIVSPRTMSAALLILTHGHSSSGRKYAGSPGATSIPKNDMSARLLEVTVLE